jgi:hypothetical protein
MCLDVLAVIDNGGSFAYLDMLFQILRTLECFTTEAALVWLQGNMNTDVRGDMVALDCSSPACVPSTRKVQVVSTLAAHVTFTDVILQRCEQMCMYIQDPSGQ